MKNPILSILVLIYALLLPIQRVAAIEPSCCPQDIRSISLDGEASVTSAPDMAVVDFTIETNDKDFRKARENNETISANVLNAIRVINLSDQNINLKNLNVNEIHEYDHKQQKSISRGYRATRNFQVNIFKRNLKANETLSEKVAQVVNAASESGITQLGNVSYSIENTYALKNKALKQAVKNAKEKAELMVTELGAKLGKVKSISENTYTPQPYVRSYAKLAMAMDAESSSMPEPDAYSEGDMTVTSRVNITFDIE